MKEPDLESERHDHDTQDEATGGDAVFDAIVTHGPLNDAWRLTLWSNYYTEPVFAEMMETFDVSRDEFNVLACLSTVSAMTAKRICEVTGRPKNSISRAVNRLAERRMIRRKTNEDDRREIRLALNESGRRLYERVLPVLLDRQTLMLSALDADDRAVLDRILNKLMSARHGW
ncbi:MarR family transcriptional regulator [Burkholderia sp. Ac-20353]|uniref:MarR family winged helix-turn-helix transcriptional regulator n=1 Tax=Burkholderia sp. Ac-20353 TaxID=2703894 RepID=UPI00197BB73F|nr:MarR family transcriptional regulator [Burkholderia sp. Ac-20353]MBN3791976.1 MarR family transcriptional regulator [Burkholderia sp. Ac-20353]